MKKGYLFLMLILGLAITTALQAQPTSGYLTKSVTLTTGTYNITGWSQTTNVTIKVGNKVTINNLRGYDGTLTINGTLTIPSDNLSPNTGSNTIIGTGSKLDLGSGNFYVQGNVTYGDSATITLGSGNLDLTNAAPNFTLGNNTTLNIYGIDDPNGVSISFGQNTTATLSSGNLTANFPSNGSIVIPTGTTLNLNSGNLSLTGGTLEVDKNGAINLQSGNLDLTSATTNSNISGSISASSMDFENNVNVLTCPASLSANSFSNNGKANNFSGSGYIQATSSFQSTNNLTTSNQITLNSTNSTANHGSAKLGTKSACSLTLPVNIVSFTAKVVGQSVVLNWATATENNNKGFELQNSTDGASFTDVTFVNSTAMNGNSSTQQNYTFTDNNPYNGVNYYRLKQVDLNGNTSYYSLVNAVSVNGAQSTIKVYPNPTSSVLNIVGATGIINIYDASGRLVLTQNASASSSINVEQFAQGVYFVNANGKKISFIKK